MPTYEYQCESCSHKFEQFQSIVAKPVSACPVCKGKVRRLISGGAGIIFKGSGFYQTDYRSPAYQKKAEAEKNKGEPGKKPTGSETSTPSSKQKTPPSPSQANPEK